MLARFEMPNNNTWGSKQRGSERANPRCGPRRCRHYFSFAGV